MCSSTECPPEGGRPPSYELGGSNRNAWRHARVRTHDCGAGHLSLWVLGKPTLRSYGRSYIESLVCGVSRRAEAGRPWKLAALGQWLRAAGQDRASNSVDGRAGGHQPNARPAATRRFLLAEGSAAGSLLALPAWSPADSPRSSSRSLLVGGPRQLPPQSPPFQGSFQDLEGRVPGISRLLANGLDVREGRHPRGAPGNQSILLTLL